MADRSVLSVRDRFIEWLKTNSDGLVKHHEHEKIIIEIRDTSVHVPLDPGKFSPMTHEGKTFGWIQKTNCPKREVVKSDENPRVDTRTDVVRRLSDLQQNPRVSEFLRDLNREKLMDFMVKDRDGNATHQIALIEKFRKELGLDLECLYWILGMENDESSRVSGGGTWHGQESLLRASIWYLKCVDSVKWRRRCAELKEEFEKRKTENSSSRKRKRKEMPLKDE
ncbi:unnamed protein product [Caenorhabditis sp. 36 PRJEB53466]|nr:unnamed protein product [Caenorhabditis sp. 36 PRJEB53466]